MKVWVQLGDDGLAVRIFSNQKEMFFECPEGREAEMERALATRQIRIQVWNRQNGTCVRCPKILTWESGHLHERETRGQGGNISLDNSEMLCYTCHLGFDGVHQNRQLRFTKGVNK